jgi:cytochrome c biogenesis protein CcmG, thiol:disulfide interchange protein DsbE
VKEAGREPGAERRKTARSSSYRRSIPAGGASRVNLLGSRGAMWSPKRMRMARRIHIRAAKWVRALGIALTVALALPLAACTASGKSQDRRNVIRFVRNPEPAPDFKLTGIDGKAINLSEQRGKVVLLNFWATWCGPCQAEIPDLIELQQKYKERLQIIGLAVDEDDAAVVRRFVVESGINYPVAMSPGELRMKYGGLAALPTSFVLDTQGRVVQKHEGLRNPLLYETEIRALLDLPIDAKIETFEDTGQIFLAHADRASELPGVDLTKLTPEQKQQALHRFNAEGCTCGCGFTLAQCRIYDRNCAVSKSRTAEIIDEIGGNKPRKLGAEAPQTQNPSQR